jgi:hypothetical protein
MASALRSIFLSILALPTSSKLDSNIRGIVWYQGENDASLPVVHNDENSWILKQNYFLDIFRKNINMVSKIAKYARKNDFSNDKFPSLLDNVIPIVLIAITSTRPSWIKEFSQNLIRQEQLSSNDPSKLIFVLDAFGYVLKPDCIHLSTSSLIDLGINVADKMISILPNINSKFNSPTLILNNNNGSINNDCIEMETLFNVSRDLTLKQYEKEDFNSENNIVNEPSSQLLSTPNLTAVIGEIKPVVLLKKSGLKAVNFVYGEVLFSSFYQVY